MSTEKARIRIQAGSTRKSFLTNDSFVNFAADMGIGANNLSSGSNWSLNPIGRNHTKLEWMYRGSWLCRKVVDCPANDMTRAGVDFTGEVSPDDIEKLHQAWKKLALWTKLNETIKWGRLYGGAIAVLMIDGQDPSTPLNEDSIKRGAFKGLMVLDRWMINASVDDFITDMGPDYGLPAYYDTVTNGSVPSMRIHHSRCMRFEGDAIPYWQRIAENGWTVSVVEQLYDRMVAFDSASTGAAQLVYKAHLRTYKIKGLREIIASGGGMYQALLQNMAMVRQMQNSEGLTLVDGEDEIEYHTNSAFGGLSDALMQFGQQLSGASGIPLVIMFGQSPSGFSTGDTDVRNYYDRIGSEQASKLDLPVCKIARILYRSVLGCAPCDGFNHNFNPLWQQTETERASNASTISTAIKGIFDSGIIDQAVALAELKQSSHETGVFSNITDEDIAEAKLAPPPAPDALAPEPGADAIPQASGPIPAPAPPAPASAPVIQPAQSPAPAQPAPAPLGMFMLGGTPENIKVNVAEGLAVRVNYNTRDTFQESKVKRDVDGQFAVQAAHNNAVLDRIPHMNGADTLHTFSGGSAVRGTTGPHHEPHIHFTNAGFRIGGTTQFDDDGTGPSSRIDYNHSDGHSASLYMEGSGEHAKQVSSVHFGTAPVPAQQAAPARTIVTYQSLAAHSKRPDATASRNADTNRYTANKLKLIDIAGASADPVAALTALNISPSFPKLVKYRAAMVAELKTAPAAKIETALATNVPKRSPPSFSDGRSAQEKQEKPTKEYLSEKLGIDPDKLVDHLLAGFPADHHNRTYITEYGPGMRVSSDITGPNGVLSTQVRVFFNDRSILHDYFKLDRSLQGSDVAKKSFAAALPAYKAAGFKRIDVHAALDVGGYAWARFGFVPKKADWKYLSGTIQARINDGERSNKISAEDVKLLRELATSADPKVVGLIAAHKHGKGLLLGTDWHGSLDLTNEKQYKHAVEYANAPRKPKVTAI